MKTLELLKAAKEIIVVPATWCKGARAKNADGVSVSALSPDAAQFCSLGALLRAADTEDRTKLIEAEAYLDKAATRNYIGHNELTNHTEVLKMFDLAIAKAEVDGR